MVKIKEAIIKNARITGTKIHIHVKAMQAEMEGLSDAE